MPIGSIPRTVFSRHTHRTPHVENANRPEPESESFRSGFGACSKPGGESSGLARVAARAQTRCERARGPWVAMGGRMMGSGAFEGAAGGRASKTHKHVT
jgi:hypothetical protein